MTSRQTCGCGDCDNQEHLLDVMGGRPEPDRFASMAEKIVYDNSYGDATTVTIRIHKQDLTKSITESLRAVDKEAYERGKREVRGE